MEKKKLQYTRVEIANLTKLISDKTLTRAYLCFAGALLDEGVDPDVIVRTFKRAERYAENEAHKMIRVAEIERILANNGLEVKWK